MYIERVPNRNSPAAVLLRESWSENGKTKKRTIGNLSGLPDDIIEAVRAAFKGETVPAALAITEPQKNLEVTDVRQHGHVAAIVAVIKRMESVRHNVCVRLRKFFRRTYQPLATSHTFYCHHDGSKTLAFRRNL